MCSSLFVQAIKLSFQLVEVKLIQADNAKAICVLLCSPKNVSNISLRGSLTTRGKELLAFCRSAQAVSLQRSVARKKCIIANLDLG